MDTAKQLKQFLIFSELDENSLSRLGSFSKTVKACKGSILFNDGDDASALFCLVSGRIDLIKSSPEGKEQLVRTVNAGELFAEAAVFSGKKYPVAAVAKKESVLIAIEKEKLIRFISLNPGVSLKMMGTMAGLLRHLNSLLGDLRLSTVESRLAAYLVKQFEMGRGKSFELKIQKNDLAFRLGTTSETLSRNLSRFKKGGLMKISGRKIEILSLSGLKKLANFQ